MINHAEEKYRQLMVYANDMIFIIDSETHQYLEVNDRAVERLGYSRDEFLQLGPGDIHKPMPVEHSKALLREINETGNVIVESVYICKDGTEIPVEISSRTIQFGNQKVWQSIVRDITERKRVEKFLKQSVAEAEFLAKLLNDSFLPFSAGTPDGRLIKINPAFCELTGYTEKELLNNITWNESLTPPEYRDYEAEILQTLLSTGKPQHFEKEYIRKDGTRIDVELHVGIKVDDKGNLDYIYGFVNDITERKKNEEALRESEESLKEAQQIAQVGSWSWDLKTNDVVWSDNLCLMHGLKPEDFDGKFDSVMSLIHPDDLEFVQQKIQKLLDGKKPIDFEYRIIARNGIVKVIHGYQKLTLDDEGNIVRMVGILQDISERKKAEDALSNSEEKHRTLFETMAQGVVYQNTDGQITSANPSAERILGLTLSQMQGRTSIDPRWRSIHEDGSDFPGETHPSMVSLKTGNPVKDVVMGVFNPKSEKYNWININAIPQFRPGEKKPYQVYTTFDDITERKKVEEALKESEERLSKAQNVSKIGSWEMDIITGAADWSDETYRLFGLEPQEFEMTFEIFKDYLHPDDRDIVLKEVGEAMMNKDSYEGMYRILRKDNKVIYVHSIAEIEHDESGKPVLIRGTIQDITERKKAEGALLESEEKFRTVFEQSPVGIMRVDLEGKPLEINPVYEKILGYNQDEFKKMEYADVTHPDDLEKENLIVKELFEGKIDRFDLDKRYIRKDGSEVWSHLTVSPVHGPSGEVQNYITVIEDITERKQSEEALKRYSNKLEESNKLKDLFIDIMRHDLLNPASAAKNMAELALSKEEDPKKKEILEIIFDTNKKIINLIDTASIFATLESGEKLEFEEMDLNVAIGDAIKEMTRLADKKKIKIILNTKGKFKALANPLIQDGFSNLISNAIKYGPENSEVVVGIEADGPNWKISIADKGEGIPDEHKKTIFERFKRIEKGAVKGTGLGLAIVKKVVEAHKGKVWVEDNPDGGSIFFVTLPKV